MTAPNETYTRNLNIDLTATFRPGSRIHGRRLNALRIAVEKAFSDALKSEMPNVSADVRSNLEWSYVFRSQSGDFTVDDDTEPGQGLSNSDASKVFDRLKRITDAA